MNNIFTRYKSCPPPKISGTLIENLEYFNSLLRHVYPDGKYDIKLGEDGFIVIFIGPEREQLISALQIMGWNIDATWPKKQIHPDAFLVVPERERFSPADNFIRSGNPDLCDSFSEA